MIASAAVRCPALRASFAPRQTLRRSIAVRASGEPAVDQQQVGSASAARRAWCLHQPPPAIHSIVEPHALHLDQSKWPSGGAGGAQAADL